MIEMEMKELKRFDFTNEINDIIAEARETSVYSLKLIYEEIIKYFPEGVEAENIIANQDFVAELMEVDEEIDEVMNVVLFYINKGPSYASKDLNLKKYEIAVINYVEKDVRGYENN
jgi:hypothetical protein